MKKETDTRILGDDILRTQPDVRNSLCVIIDTHWDEFECDRRRNQSHQKGHIYQTQTKPFEYTLNLYNTIHNEHTPDSISLSKESASARWASGLCIIPWCTSRKNMRKGTCGKHYHFLYKIRRKTHTIKAGRPNYPLFRKRKRSD